MHTASGKRRNRRACTSTVYIVCTGCATHDACLHQAPSHPPPHAHAPPPPHAHPTPTPPPPHPASFRSPSLHCLACFITKVLLLPVCRRGCSFVCDPGNTQVRCVGFRVAHVAEAIRAGIFPARVLIRVRPRKHPGACGGSLFAADTTQGPYSTSSRSRNIPSVHARLCATLAIPRCVCGALRWPIWGAEQHPRSSYNTSRAG